MMAAEDGQITVQEIQGRKGWFGKPFKSGHSIFIYFRVHDSFKADGLMNATVEIEYFDAAPGQLRVEFDGNDASAPFHGAYTHSETIPIAGDKRWKTATFKLNAARFLNSQNAGADLRIAAEAMEFGLGKATLRRR